VKQLRITVTDGIAATAHHIATAASIPYDQVYQILFLMSCQGLEMNDLIERSKKLYTSLRQVLAMDEAITKKGGS
jgi:hypothetical protein